MTWLETFVRDRTTRGVRRALRDLRLAYYFQRLHRRGVRRARQFAGRRPLQLNLGSGFRPRPGWINVDLTDQAELQLDLREPLPFEDDSVAGIYSEHFLEHLDYPAVDRDSAGWELERADSRSEALSFLRECRRVLCPGGLLDIVVPDAEAMILEYAMRHEQPFPRHAWWGPSWCDTPLHCVNYVFRQGTEHKYAYDYETLTGVLASAGFAPVTRRSFDPSIDSPNHQLGSLFVQAQKPRAPEHL